MASDIATVAGSRHRRAGPLSGERVWLYTACVPVLLFLVGPILIIVPLALTKGNLLIFPPQLASLRHFRDLFADATWMHAALTSLKVALVATSLATVTGAASAIALHRNEIPGRALITTLILLPVIVPVVVLALGDYLFMSRLGLLHGWLPIGLAHTVLVTPYVYIAVQASLAGLDPALSRAASSLGAGSFALLTAVYWPAIRSGLLAGALLAFVGSFDEVVIAFFLSGPNSTTLPVQMFTAIQFDLTPKIAAVSSLLFAMSVLLLAGQAVLVNRASRKR